MVRLVLWQCMHLSMGSDIEPGDFVVIDQSGVNAGLMGSNKRPGMSSETEPTAWSATARARYR